MADILTSELYSADSSQAPLLVLPDVTIMPAAPAARVSLRCRETGLALAAKAFGTPIPQTPLTAETAANRAAFWLGPDEWMLVAPESQLAAILSDLETHLDAVPHSVVDISHRQDAVLVSGPRAGWLLNTGVPIDLHESAFAVGTVTRTLFHKTPIMLWRTGPDSFVVEAWGSFMDYVTGLLVQSAEELKAA
ncbi:sarcosine oxidase subunit gamma [Roseibium aquae]|uniref:Sarcosine oxidase subunit gamma n=1 Tax=Roseibium aquae TaxID=1323746 RepID=A0A916X0H9_9HYPH|nr:sarcosine oxidase subunit gamma family protein [Roseibium aquae]GGB44157.1 sarcosine oxidase subunit gamma [Roseibium aquae]